MQEGALTAKNNSSMLMARVRNVTQLPFPFRFRTCMRVRGMQQVSGREICGADPIREGVVFFPQLHNRAQIDRFRRKLDPPRITA